MNIEMISMITYYLIGIWTSIALLCIKVGTSTYRKLIVASETMGITNHPLLVQMKNKYDNCYKHRLSVNNSRKFIEKQINKFTIKGIKLKVIEGVPEKLVMVTAATGVISIAFLYYIGCRNQSLVNIAFITIASVAINMTLQVLTDVSAKKENVFANITDYLENYLRNRLEQEYGNATLDPEWSEAIVLNTILNNDYNEEIEMQIEQLVKSMKQIATTCEDQEEDYFKVRNDEKMIQEILEEFLT